jgi:hypothetical protein
MDVRGYRRQQDVVYDDREAELSSRRIDEEGRPAGPSESPGGTSTGPLNLARRMVGGMASSVAETPCASAPIAIRTTPASARVAPRLVLERMTPSLLP